MLTLRPLVGAAIAMTAASLGAQPRVPRLRLVPAPPTLDCTAGAPACPPLAVAGDGEQVIPGYGPSPFRGLADPSLRRHPQTGGLWMAYSWPHVQVLPPAEPGGPFRLSAVVDIHLAHSDDGGDTWTFDGTLWSSTAEIDPGGSGTPGFSSHEVVSMAPLPVGGNTRWAAARLGYFVPEAGGLLGRRGDSFHLRITAADTPAELGDGPDAILAGALTAPGWDADVDLSALDPSLTDCHIWNEPALLFDAGTLYLAAQCLVFDLLTGEPRDELGSIELFATDPAGEVRSWIWRHAGRLAGHAEAAALGEKNLTQVDLAWARDGTLLALVTPNHWDSELNSDVHRGCRVLEVASLEPPLLRRSRSGGPLVRMAITASDLDTYGPAAFGYDAASSTGIVFVRRVFDTEEREMVWTLHRTSLHP